MRHFYTLTLTMLVPLLFTTTGMTAVPGADRVEEDWQIVLAIPNPDLTCPQISTTMIADPSAPSAVFSLNYQDFPNFVPGGLQARIVRGDATLASSVQGSAQFQTAGETITWTQRLTLSGGTLYFKITNGQSTTWGPFGEHHSRLSVNTASQIDNMDKYDPGLSVSNSRPSFGMNRVASMTLLQVRYYQGQTLLATDSTARQVAITGFN